MGEIPGDFRAWLVMVGDSLLNRDSASESYVPCRPGSLPWRALSVIWWVMLRPSVVSRDTRHRSRDQLMNDAIETSIGSRPDAEDRQNALKLLMYGAIIGGFVTGTAGLVLGALMQPIVGVSAGVAIMKAFGVALAAPCVAFGVVWAGRAQLNESDLRRWRGVCSRRPYRPSPITQPKNRDALYALPIWLLLAGFFLSV